MGKRNILSNLLDGARILNGSALVMRSAGWALSLCLALHLTASAAASAASVAQVADFGSNPGNLSMFKYVPDGLPPSAPLVVVMHGCAQRAAAFAQESGWTKIADELKVALVLPETDKPLANGCFTWYNPGDVSRDHGEALSIKNMVDKMKADHGIDAKRIFATGLSAGGAMTSVMLATYPDVFAGGAIVAGLPYGCATSLPEAFQCMSTGHPSALPALGKMQKVTLQSAEALPDLSQLPVPKGVCLLLPLLCPPTDGQGISASQWGDFVRKAANFPGPFPKVSIWHGSADTTVSPVNATSEMLQWTNVHGIDPASAAHDTVKGFPHQLFKNAAGDAVVETYSITAMSHGDPVDPGSAADQCGAADQYIIDEHICSSYFIAKFWGLAAPAGAK